MARRKKRDVVVLNTAFEPMGMIPFNDALTAITKGKAYAYAAAKDQFVQGPVQQDGSRFVLPWPTIIIQRKWVYVDHSKVKPIDPVLASRMAILHRDDFTCQYCGADASTIDHIYPQWKGGENTWLNLVAACLECNQKKAGYTLEEIAAMGDEELLERGFDGPMKLFREPFVPDGDKFTKEKRIVKDMLEKGTILDIGDEY